MQAPFHVSTPVVAQNILSSNAVWLAAAVIGLIFVLIFLAVFARFARLWILSFMTKAGVGIFDLLRM